MRLVGQVRSTAWVSWIATLLWIGIVALESTDLFSASHTGHLLSALLAMLHLHTEEQTVSYLNIVLRKLGHFVGYGVLSWLFFALGRPPFRSPPAGHALGGASSVHYNSGGVR